MATNPAPADPARRGPRRSYSPEMEEHANTQSALAAQMLGLLVPEERYERCPVGGHIKLDLKPLGAHCQSCGANATTAVRMLVLWGHACGLWPHDITAHPKGSREARRVYARACEDAVLLLNGKPARNCKVVPPEKMITQVITKRESVVDTELYDALILAGRKETHGLSAIAAAEEYHTRFGIEPVVVFGSGCVKLTDERAFQSWVKAEFGQDRLIAAGVFNDTGFSLFNRRYDKIEPHLHPTWAPGAVTATSMQFRASVEQEQVIKAYVAAKKAGETTYPDGTKVRYVPKFLSLGGAPDHARVGFGLERFDDQPVVYVCEGDKDAMAGATMGFELSDKLFFYGLPGAGTEPPLEVMEMFGDAHIVLCFDNDDAGRAGSLHVLGKFAEAGCENLRTYTPQVGDIADGLMLRLKDGKPPALSRGEAEALYRASQPWEPPAVEPAAASDAA